MDGLCAEWLAAKEIERASVERRRIAEDRMLSMIGIAENAEGTQFAEAEGGYKIKVVSRLARKIDAERVQEIAAEHGLTEHLTSLFRWRPELNVAAWKAADASITTPFAMAITIQPGRASFAIQKET